MIYLYIKTHNVTGLKYLGKTVAKNPYTYKGSGKYWRRHIKLHGYNVTTDIVFQTDSEDELMRMGKFYSNFYNVVESKEWANLKEESGDGGWNFVNINEEIRKNRKLCVGELNGFYGKKHTDETKKRLSECAKKQIFPVRTKEHNEKIKNALTGKKFTEQRKKNISDSKKGKPAHNKGVPDLVITCPHCNKGGGRSNMKRWHFDNCKDKK